MGCSGSKTSTQAATAATKTSQIPEGDFKINFENAAGSEDLGVVASFPEKTYIFVEEVKDEGLIPSWNKSSENTPEMQLKSGDSIVVVNGVFGDSDLMLAELKRPAITMTVKRGGPLVAAAAAPAAEAPAAEAPAAAAPICASAAEAAVAEAPAAEAAAPAAETPAVEAAAATVPTTEGAASAPPAAEAPFAEQLLADALPQQAPAEEDVELPDGVVCPVCPSFFQGFVVVEPEDTEMCVN